MLLPSRILLTASVAVLVDAAALSTVTLDCVLAGALIRLGFVLIFSPDGTFTGLTDTTNQIIYFRGVRYADPPVGALRFRAPVSPPTTQLGNVNATNVSYLTRFWLHCLISIEVWRHLHCDHTNSDDLNDFRGLSVRKCRHMPTGELQI
jgi:hypothetical protein